ncbi:MAG: hypothetical protein ACRCWG_12825 [Sarcina sp.]
MMSVGVAIGIIAYLIVNKFINIGEWASKLIKIDTKWKPAILVAIFIIGMAIISGVVGVFNLGDLGEGINGLVIGVGVMFIARIIPKQFKYM